MAIFLSLYLVQEIVNSKVTPIHCKDYAYAYANIWTVASLMSIAANN